MSPKKFLEGEPSAPFGLITTILDHHEAPPSSLATPTPHQRLVWFEQAWWSVWYSAITDIRTDPANSSLDLFFEVDPPYRLIGPHIPALAVVLAQGVRGENFEE